MNGKAEQKERTHETILASAARLLRARGISGARVADVMQGAGLTVGGFYAHFASKEELIDETLRRTSAELRGRLFDGIEDKPATDRVEVVLKRYLSAAHRDAQSMGCPLPAVVGEVGADGPAHRAALAEQVGAMIEGLEEMLPAHRAAPRRLLALGLVALMYGGLSLARALQGTALSDEFLRACRALGVAAARGDGLRAEGAAAQPEPKARPNRKLHREGA